MVNMNTVTEAEYKSEFVLTKDCENFGEIWLHYKGTTL